jgi:hypothetical protein
MSGESGAAPAKEYREASQKEKEHLLEHMTVHFAGDEIRIGYGMACINDKKCTFPKPAINPRVTASIRQKLNALPKETYKEVVGERKKHVLEHMTLHFADDEIKISYGIECGDQNCKFPHTNVTVAVCPYYPCKPAP